MKYAGIMLFCLLAGSLTAGNLLYNSSFELDLADFGLMRLTRNHERWMAPVPDAAEKIHGSQSLRFDNPQSDSVELISREVPLKGGRDYMFSAYVKSSAPLKMRVAIISGSTGKWIVHKDFWSVTPERWNRYFFRIRAPEDGAYFAELRWGQEKKVANSATVWLDAIQLSEGKSPEKYAPRTELECGVSMPRRVSVERKSLPLIASARNSGSSPKKIMLPFSVYDTINPENVIQTGTVDFTLAPGETQRKKIMLSPSRFGHFTVVFPSENTVLHFAVVRAPAPGLPNLKQSRYIGLDCDFSTGNSSGVAQFPVYYSALEGSFDDYMEFIQNSGTKILRAGNTGEAFSWKKLEPTPGTFDFSEPDRMTNSAAAHGMAVMPVLGNMFYLRDRPGLGKRVWNRLPEFVTSSAKRLPLGYKWDGLVVDSVLYQRYAAAFAKHFAGRIPAYELTNEPNICIPADEYGKLAAAAVTGIRSVDRNAMIGSCQTTDYGGKGTYLNELGKTGVLSRLDMIGFHPYGSRQENSALSALSALESLRRTAQSYHPGIVLWNTELYYLFDTPERSMQSNDVYQMRGCRPRHLIRRLAIDFGEGVMQSMPLGGHLILSGGELQPSWNVSPGYVQNALIPNPMYAAQSAGGYWFNECLPLGRLNWPKEVHGYVFRHRDGTEFAVCWRSDSQATCHLTLPESGVDLLDLYSNERSGIRRVEVTEEPIFLRGEDLKRLLSQNILSIGSK